MRLPWFSWLSFAILFLGLALAASSFLDPGKEGTGSPLNVFLPQKIRSIPLDRNFSFGGERLKTEQFDIRERLERELLINAYLHANTLLSIKRSARFFPVIERILEEEGMPDDLKYLAVAESALGYGTSSAGARGIWQFMEPTAKYYGLEVSEDVDERLHLEKSTRAACRYLKGYREQFGSWHLAACAYNMGGPRLKKEISAQRAESFEELNLNSETSRYLFRIVALKTILEDPAAFGYDLHEKDYHPELKDFREISVSGPVASWADFARDNGTNYRMLKVYNPWLVSRSLANKAGKTYLVRVPKQD